MGRGIHVAEGLSKQDLKELFDPHRGDVIIQELVTQHESMKMLNPSSLNCIRVTTLNINNKITATNALLKIGAKDSVVDNIGSGSGGLAVGISPVGKVLDFGMRVDGTIIDKNNGFSFENFQIPYFQEILDTAVLAHSKVPSMGIVGWDIALNSSCKPVLIEGNSFWPGITIEQICSGPIFGERTAELTEYLKNITS